MNKIKLKKLNSSTFIYELHEMDNSNLIWENAEGYCKSEDVSCLSKINNMCVMFFDKERGNFWVHIPYALFELHFKIDEPYEEKEESIEDWENEFERIKVEHEIEERRKEYLASIYKSIFQRNLDSVSAKSNKDNLQYFVGEYGGWWAFNYQEYLDNPNNVKVVNDVGGYHYSDLTKKDIKIAKCINRKFLLDLE